MSIYSSNGVIPKIKSYNYLRSTFYKQNYLQNNFK